jgi:O-antigen/teichoic acid export membrane protein
MSCSFENPEYASTPSALPTDTLVDSVLILLGLAVVQRLVGFVRAVLFCRWLDAEQLGQWDMMFSFLLLAAPLSVLAIPGAFGRYLEHYRQKGQFRLFLRWSIVACSGFTLMACTIILFLRGWFSLLIFGSEEQSSLVALAAGSLVAVIAYNFLIELFTALRNIRLVSIMQLVNSVAFAVWGIALLVGWQCTAESVLLAYGGSCLVAAAWAGFRLPRVWHSAPPLPLATGSAIWSRVVPFAAWVLLWSVLVNLFSVVDRYMIVHFSAVSPTEALDMVGNYHTSRVVPLLLVSLAAMLATMILPHLSHDWEAGRKEAVAARLRLFLKMFGFSMFAAATGVLLAGPLLFQVALRGKFPGGEALLPWTLVYCTWFSFLLIAQNYLLCAEKARYTSIAIFCGLSLSIPLNALLLPRIGLEGAVLATAAANATSLAVVCFFNWRLGFRLDNGAKLVLVLPLVLCFGPWAAMLALAAVAVDAVFSDRLLSPAEKEALAEGLAHYGQRMRRYMPPPPADCP